MGVGLFLYRGLPVCPKCRRCCWGCAGAVPLPLERGVPGLESALASGGLCVRRGSLSAAGYPHLPHGGAGPCPSDSRGHRGPSAPRAVSTPEVSGAPLWPQGGVTGCAPEASQGGVPGPGETPAWGPSVSERGIPWVLLPVPRGPHWPQGLEAPRYLPCGLGVPSWGGGNTPLVPGAGEPGAGARSVWMSPGVPPCPGGWSPLHLKVKVVPVPGVPSGLRGGWGGSPLALRAPRGSLHGGAGGRVLLGSPCRVLCVLAWGSRWHIGVKVPVCPQGPLPGVAPPAGGAGSLWGGGDVDGAAGPGLAPGGPDVPWEGWVVPLCPRVEVPHVPSLVSPQAPRGLKVPGVPAALARGGMSTVS